MTNFYIVSLVLVACAALVSTDKIREKRGFGGGGFGDFGPSNLGWGFGKEDRINIASGWIEGKLANGWGSFGRGKGGSGGPVSSIAKGPSFEAQNARAKQELAVQQAAYTAKSSLAKQAALTADAAASGKKSVVDALQQAVTLSHKQINAELRQLNSLQASARAAMNAVASAKKQYASLIVAIDSAQKNIIAAEGAASKVGIDVGAQEQKVALAKLRAMQASTKLRAAQSDFERTRTQAHRASSIAANAVTNAAVIASQISATTVNGSKQGQGWH